MVGPILSAIIVSPEVEKKKGRKHKSERLREGDEKRFKQVGTQVGAALAVKGKTVST